MGYGGTERRLRDNRKIIAENQKHFLLIVIYHICHDQLIVKKTFDFMQRSVKPSAAPKYTLRCSVGHILLEKCIFYEKVLDKSYVLIFSNVIL